MKIIAHRANLNGPNIESENKVHSIRKCLDLGYDVEIDIRLIDGKLFLGHDVPQESIEIEELIEINEKCWIHCKNLAALTFLNKNGQGLNYFWHEKDSYTLTSKGFIWTYPGEHTTYSCICVMPELFLDQSNFSNLLNMRISGICTDYPNKFKIEKHKE